MSRVTRTPLSTSKGKRSTCRGGGILWRPPAELVFAVLVVWCMYSRPYASLWTFKFFVYYYELIKVNVHTLDIAPLRSETPPQKRSDMACVLNEFHSFTCTPTRSSAIVMSHTCLCLPSRSWYSFTDPGGMEGCEVAPAKIRNLQPLDCKSGTLPNSH